MGLWLVALLSLAGCAARSAPPLGSDPAATGREPAALQQPSATPLPRATDPLPTAPPTVEPTVTSSPEPTATLPTPAPLPSATLTPAFPSRDPYPMQIDVMRQQTYPGSKITVEQTLSPGANYKRYVVSYLSDGYKVYALMTVPTGKKPAAGWPAIIFNHGFIPPPQYRTTERYVAYVDAIARSGYIVFKPDYRGHGNSEGVAEGAYGFPGYTDDVLNSLASVKAYGDVDPNRIGMWGHSMGGQLTLRAMVLSKDIKAGVIWSGVVAPYPDVFARANHPGPTRVPLPTEAPPGDIGPYGRRWRQDLIDKYGTPEQNPDFWASISPNSYLADISGPLQLHASITDEEVPVESSQTLYGEMQAAGRPAELFTYLGDNHNISGHFTTAMQRTVAFFDKYVKGS
jgi:fermentation-respiration switch protein FrsA (DUF1100 family)